MTERVVCRNCSAELETVFVDLGMSPLANSYLTADQLASAESFYPLRVFVCHSCFLVQLGEIESPQRIFRNYAYFSSASQSWLEHCKSYAERIIAMLDLGASSEVVEIASNDGYLLQYFARRQIRVLGIEPAENVATVAQSNGVPTVVDFFGSSLAQQLCRDHHPRLMIGNNVLAHVPDIHDFIEGMRILLAEDGVITMEFPHLLRLVQELQFDTIYHEHYSYLSLDVVRRLFDTHDLEIVRVEELETHGGSLRIWAEHKGAGVIDRNESVEELLKKEERAGLNDMHTYRFFHLEVLAERTRILEVVTSLKQNGKQIAGYGAPAKANTLLNYCGIGRDLVEMTFDVSPAKQGKYLPGTHIPIYPRDELTLRQPDVVWVFPWNLKTEIRVVLDELGWKGETLIRSPGHGLVTT